MTVSASYFDGMYASSPDPWGFTSRWYEARKYAITMAMLPRARYRDVFEPGCSIGVLSDLLAPRCERLLCCDIAPAAVQSAAQRTAAHPNVVVQQRALPRDWPAGQFDLIVLSEILYYFAGPDLDEILNLTAAALRPGATLLAVHWRHPVAEHPRSGDNVHAALAARPELAKLAEHTEADFRAEAYLAGRGQPVSVAAAEGLLANGDAGPVSGWQAGAGCRPGRLSGQCGGETGERHRAPVLGPARLGRRGRHPQAEGPGMVTTTHDPRGGGRPRLIFAFGGTAPQHASQREFDLLPGVTVIGSGPDADLHLEGLEARHAEIRRDERDEYVYVDLGSQPVGRVNGQEISGKKLRTGDRIELGDWTLSFFREEFADHGIPFGGRHGGDPHPVQEEPRPRGTSPEGGSDRTADDPGEYF